LKRAEVTAAKKNVLYDVISTPALGTVNKDKKVLSGHHNSQVAKVRASPHSNKKASVNVKGNNGVLNSITPMATIDDRTQLNKCRLQRRQVSQQNETSTSELRSRQKNSDSEGRRIRISSVNEGSQQSSTKERQTADAQQQVNKRPTLDDTVKKRKRVNLRN